MKYSSSNTPQMYPSTQTCPVLLEAQNVIDVSQDLAKAMRRLRRKLSHCADCDKEGICPALKTFQGQIKTAIAELSEEWV